MAETVGKDFWNNSQEMKAVRAIGRKASALGSATKAAILGNRQLETGMTPEQEKEYKRTIGMSAKAWAKEKKKAGVKD